MHISSHIRSFGLCRAASEPRMPLHTPVRCTSAHTKRECLHQRSGPFSSRNPRPELQKRRCQPQAETDGSTRQSTIVSVDTATQILDEDLRNRTEAAGAIPSEAQFTEIPSSRFFSNLDPSTLKHEPGTVWGSALLVAGTTVGAGILALPAVTQPAGFVASSLALLGAGGYSIATGLLIAEVNLMTMCELGAGGVSLVTMAERTLGKTGTNIASAAYLFLHYALLVAYISKASDIASDVTGGPFLACAVVFSAGFGAFCFFLSPKLMDQINGFLVLLVIAAFVGLVGVAGSGADPSALLSAHWEALPPAIPVIMLAFVFQNVVPVIVANLEGDPNKIRGAIILGVAIPFLMFLSWEAAILGNTALLDSATSSANSSGGVFDPLQLLQQASPVAAPLIQGFSFLAVATSFIGFILGLTDFLAGLMRLPSGGRQPLPYVLTLAPPFVLALTFPDIFFQALDVAGTYGVLTLFGLMPVAMAWSERYGSSTVSSAELVPGGKPVLVLLAGLASAVILNEMVNSLQHVLAS